MMHIVEINSNLIGSDLLTCLVAAFFIFLKRSNFRYFPNKRGIRQRLFAHWIRIKNNRKQALIEVDPSFLVKCKGDCTWDLNALEN